MREENKFFLILFSLVMLLTVAVHLVYVFDEGRLFLNADLNFYNPYFSIMNSPHSWDQMISQYTSQKALFYLFNNFLFLALEGMRIPVNLTLVRLANLAYYFLLIFGIYRLGASLHNRSVGLLSAAMVAAVPILDNFSRSFTVQFHIIGPIVLAIALATDQLKKPGSYGAFAGIATLCALSVLIHPIGLFFSAILYFFFLVFLLGQKHPRKSRLIRYGFSVALFGILIFPLYSQLPNYFVEKTRFFYSSGFSLPSLANTFGLWETLTFKVFFGVWNCCLLLVLLAGIFLMGKKIKISLSSRESFLFFITTSYLLFSLYIALHAAEITDVMIFNALVPPLLLSVFAKRTQEHRYGRHIIFVLAIAVFLSSGIIKARLLTPIDRLPDDEYFVSHYRHIVVDPDWIQNVQQTLAEQPEFNDSPICTTSTFVGHKTAPDKMIYDLREMLKCGLHLLGRPVVYSCVPESAPIHIEFVFSLERQPADFYAQYLLDHYRIQPNDHRLLSWKHLNQQLDTYDMVNQLRMVIVHFPTKTVSPEISLASSTTH
ncbi:MAG TPA: hypothetical protein PKW95_10080 [bacterium]|nr:hypothetical protein [bacterium]